MQSFFSIGAGVYLCAHQKTKKGVVYIMECGIDIIEVNRVKNAIEHQGNDFLHKIYTDKEIEYCNSKGVQSFHSYAARFSAKEAIAKLLKTGFNGEIDWKEIEVINNQAGAPEIILYGKTKELMEAKCINSIKISISHSREYATSMVIGY